jgi:hypothetical protein
MDFLLHANRAHTWIQSPLDDQIVARFPPAVRRTRLAQRNR